MNKSICRIVVQTPRNAVWRFIILFYLIAQFLLPLAFVRLTWLCNLTFISALPLTIILLLVVRSIRLAAQGQAGNSGNTGSQTKCITKADIDALSWQQFERFVGEVYRRGGYRVEQKGGHSADGGIDLILHSDSGQLLVQCKHWKVYRVGVKPVRELFGVMVSEGAVGAILVTGGSFTTEARSWAAGKPLLLVDGSQFIAQANQSQSGQALPLLEAVQAARQSTVPACPVCSRRMQKRVARSGANAGSEFWGCPAFPRCRGTRQIERTENALR